MGSAQIELHQKLDLTRETIDRLLHENETDMVDIIVYSIRFR